MNPNETRAYLYENAALDVLAQCPQFIRNFYAD